MPFSDVNFQKRPITVLQKAVRNNRIAHAYLFAGSKGVGKLEVAKLFAEAINCTEMEGDGCGKCKSCSMISRSMNPNEVVHPDVVHLVPGQWIGDDGRKQSSYSIVIGAVRQLCSSLYSAPLMAKWRIVVIHDADTMQISAQNAFLKTLEEPQEKLRTIFILVSSRPLKLLQTIRSRCQTVIFGSVSNTEIIDRIKNEESWEGDDAQAEKIAAFSSGNLNMAINLALQREGYSLEMLEERERWLLLWHDTIMNNGDFSTIVNEFGRSRDVLQMFLALLLSWHRDLLLLKRQSDVGLLTNSDMVTHLNAEAETFTEKQIIHRLERIIEITDSAELYVRGDLALEAMLGEIYLGM